MIDFNTILNTAFQSAVEAQTKPLLEKIEEQDIDGIVESTINDTVDNKIASAIEDYDFSDAIDKGMIEDIVREVRGNATFTTEVSL